MRSVFLFALLVRATFALPAIEIRESFVTMPIAALINTTNIRNILEADRARVRHFVQRAHAENTSADSSDNVPITDVVLRYIASVGVGTPPTQYNLIVDTGSSNTWVGAGKPFIPTSSTQSTGQFVNVTYGTNPNNAAFFGGSEFVDTVTLAPGLTINNQSIGVANSSGGVQYDGILGLGPPDLTVRTLTPNQNEIIPTVVDNLFSQGTIPLDMISISFEPTTSLSEKNGEITFGGIDSSKYTGEITFVPITTTFPANQYWGIDQSITYGTTNILSTTSGIVDTGSPFILLANDAYARYRSATGAVLDSATGLLKVTADQFNNLQNLDFNIGGTTFSLTPNAQAWPRALVGGDPGDIYLIVSNTGNPSGSGVDFLNGQSFLERFYSVFDASNQRVGLATTPFTNATTN